MTKQKTKNVYAIREGCTNRRYGNCDLKAHLVYGMSFFKEYKHAVMHYDFINDLQYQQAVRWNNRWVNLQLVEYTYLIEGDEYKLINEQLIAESWIDLNDKILKF